VSSAVLATGVQLPAQPGTFQL